MPQVTQWMSHETQELRRYLQEGADSRLTLRRCTLVASLVGVAAVALTTLLHTATLACTLPEALSAARGMRSR